MGTNIELKDLYNEEQTYEDIGTVAVPKADGSGNEYYVKRPVINYTLLDPPTHEVATTQVQDIFAWNAGDGTILGVSDDGNFFGAAYAAVSGKTTKPIVSIITWKHLTGATVNSAGRAHIIYLYEELAGSVLQEVVSYAGSTDFTAQVGWGQLLLDDNNSVTGYAKIDDPSAVSIGIEQPNVVMKADIFYSLLSEVTQEAQTLSVRENGEQTIVPTAGKSGIRKVALNVNVPQQELQEKSVTLTQNGTTEVTPDEGYGGMSKLTAIVNVAGGGSGVQPDWNQNDSTAADFVKNRPGAFEVPQKDAVTITWDGVAGDKETVDMGGFSLVKVSDEIFYPPNIYGATITSKRQNNEFQKVVSRYGYDVTYVSNGITTIGNAFEIVSIVYPVDLGGGLQLSVGTWFQKVNDTTYTKELSTVSGENPGDPVYVLLDGESMVNFGTVSQYGLRMKVGSGCNVNEDVGAAIGTNLVTNTKNGLVVGTHNIPSVSKLFIVGNGNESVSSNAFSVGTDGNVEVGGQEIVIKSSTAGSTKKFKITVDDTGMLTATEVTS